MPFSKNFVPLQSNLYRIITKTFKTMKKLFYCLTAVALVAGLASCDKKDKEETDGVNPTTPTTTDVEFAGGYVEFYGTDYGTEANNFSLALYTDMTADEDGYFNSKGSDVQIDLYAEGGEDEDGNITLVAGTYTLSDDEDYPAGTFSVDYSKWFEIDDAGEQTRYGIKEGTVVIAANGDAYDIKINLVDSLGNTRIGTYNGELDVYDEREDPYDGEPTEAEKITVNAPKDSIEAYNYGDYYNSGTDNLAIYVWDDNTTVSLSLYVASGATTLPVGEYKFADDYSDMSLEAGELYYSMFAIGSYAVTEDAYYWLTDGTVNVSLGEDSIYTISGTLTSHYGSEISVNYTGKVAIEDNSDYDDDDDDDDASYVAPKNIRKAAVNHKKAALRIKK